eukprot:Rhum_TRINITY_DN15085_c0_g1::Rhum_TRINITY_DN15085_c0_g1_i1::g.135942::m.135942
MGRWRELRGWREQVCRSLFCPVGGLRTNRHAEPKKKEKNERTTTPNKQIIRLAGHMQLHHVRFFHVPPLEHSDVIDTSSPRSLFCSRLCCATRSEKARLLLRDKAACARYFVSCAHASSTISSSCSTLSPAVRRYRASSRTSRRYSLRSQRMRIEAKSSTSRESSSCPASSSTNSVSSRSASDAFLNAARPSANSAGRRIARTPCSTAVRTSARSSRSCGHATDSARDVCRAAASSTSLRCRTPLSTGSAQSISCTSRVVPRASASATVSSSRSACGSASTASGTAATIAAQSAASACSRSDRHSCSTFSTAISMSCAASWRGAKRGRRSSDTTKAGSSRRCAGTSRSVWSGRAAPAHIAARATSSFPRTYSGSVPYAVAPVRTSSTSSPWSSLGAAHTMLPSATPTAASDASSSPTLAPVSGTVRSSGHTTASTSAARRRRSPTVASSPTSTASLCPLSLHWMWTSIVDWGSLLCSLCSVVSMKYRYCSFY